MSSRATLKRVLSSPWRQLQGGGTPAERLRREFDVLFFGLVLAIVLFGLHWMAGFSYPPFLFAAGIFVLVALVRTAAAWIDFRLIKSGWWSE